MAVLTQLASQGQDLRTIRVDPNNDREVCSAGGRLFVVAPRFAAFLKIWNVSRRPEFQTVRISEFGMHAHASVERSTRRILQVCEKHCYADEECNAFVVWEHEYCELKTIRNPAGYAELFNTPKAYASKFVAARKQKKRYIHFRSVSLCVLLTWKRIWHHHTVSN